MSFLMCLFVFGYFGAHAHTCCCVPLAVAACPRSLECRLPPQQAIDLPLPPRLSCGPPIRSNFENEIGTPPCPTTGCRRTDLGARSGAQHVRLLSLRRVLSLVHVSERPGGNRNVSGGCLPHLSAPCATTADTRLVVAAVCSRLCGCMCVAACPSAAAGWLYVYVLYVVLMFCWGNRQRVLHHTSSIRLGGCQQHRLAFCSVCKR